MIRNFFRPLAKFFGGQKPVQQVEPPKIEDAPIPEAAKTGERPATKIVYPLTVKQHKARHKARLSKAGRQRQYRLAKGLAVCLILALMSCSPYREVTVHPPTDGVCMEVRQDGEFVGLLCHPTTDSVTYHLIIKRGHTLKIKG